MASSAGFPAWQRRRQSAALEQRSNAQVHGKLLPPTSDAHRSHEPSEFVLVPRPSSSCSIFWAQRWIRGRERRTRAEQQFMESFNLQNWTRIGAMNQLGEVGRVTPCAPSFAVLGKRGCRRRRRGLLALPFRFMESLDLQDWTRVRAMKQASSSSSLVPRLSSLVRGLDSLGQGRIRRRERRTRTRTSTVAPG
jgi:hypothetical protein